MTSPVRLSAHIGYLFTELPLESRIAAARRAGFDAIEHPNPLSIPARRLRELLDGEGLFFIQMAAGLGDPTRGEKGLAALPGRKAEFRDNLDRVLDYAEAIGCRLVHPMAGVPFGPGSEAAETYRENLAFTVDRCRSRPVTVLVEAISEAAVPGYFLSTLDKALACADAVAPSDILVRVDTFHAAANGVDAAAFLDAHMARVGHVHIADHPGRHEPGTGHVDFGPLLDRLTARDYRGAVGFEYVPSTAAADSLSWLPRWKQRFR